MTESQFRAHIISALRQASRWWKPKNKAIARARVGKGMYKCEMCGQIGPPTLPAPKGKKRKIKNILADHITPIIGVEGFTSYDDWIERCFVTADKFQAICHECHSGKDGKTQKENEGRRIFKKMEEEYSGLQYGKLVILSYVGDNKFLCECDCGKQTIVNIYNLKSGHTKSCGCIMGTHKMSGTKFYKTWTNINSRCNNPNSQGFKYYGGRGIICEWNSFEEFYDDMFSSYVEGLTIDRIDVNGNYCKKNCKWSTYKEQGNNKRENHILEYDGLKHTISEWADLLNIKQNTILYRIKRGWTIGEALGLEERILQEKTTLKIGNLENILSLRDKGLTQEQIGDIYGVDGSVVSRFLKKHTKEENKGRRDYAKRA